MSNTFGDENVLYLDCNDEITVVLCAIVLEDAIIEGN